MIHPAAHWLIAALVLIIGGSAQAAFVTIDDFSMPTPATNFSVNPASGSNNPLTLTSPTGYGATRSATMTVDSVPQPFSLTGEIGFESNVYNRGVFRFDTASTVLAHAVLHYGSFTGGSLNFNAVGAAQFFDVSFYALQTGTDVSTNGPAVNMPLDIAISTTGGTLTGSFLATSSSSQVTFQVPISSLSGTGNLSQVLAIDLTFNNPGGGNERIAPDFVVDDVGLEVAVSPAPPTALLALFGAPVLAWLRKRRR